MTGRELRAEKWLYEAYLLGGYDKAQVQSGLVLRHLQNGKLLERCHEYGEVAIISKDEIIGLLEETGFDVVCVYGDFDKSKHRKGSSKTVLVTKRE